MAVEGKLRSLIAQLETLGSKSNLRFRPFSKKDIEGEVPQIENDGIVVRPDILTARIEIGVNKEEDNSQYQNTQ